MNFNSFPSVANTSVDMGNTGLDYNLVSTSSTVVPSAYDTSSTGGRKLVQLSNGSLYSAMKNGTSWYIYKSTDNGNTWALFKNATETSFTDISLATDGVYLFVLRVTNTGLIQGSYKDDGTFIGVLNTIDTGQNALDNCSLVFNAVDNTLHATYASKNSTVLDTFNIRYSKGTVNADGSVTWGAVEQVTTYDSPSYPNFARNPSIALSSTGIPLIFIEQNNVSFSGTGYAAGSNINAITVLKRDNTLTTGNIYLASGWSYKIVYSGGTYVQTKTSAIFVPQSINGLTNGQLWATWYGTDSTDVTYSNIHVAHSNDDGVTWIAQKVTSGNTYAQLSPSITATSSNKVFIVWFGYVSNTSTYQVREVSYDGTAWSSISTITNIQNANNTAATIPNPQTLFNLALDFTQPPIIYRDNDRTSIRFNTIQMVPTPPEMYIPLWWYSSTNTGTNATTLGSSFLDKGQGFSISTTSMRVLHTLNANWNPNLLYALEITFFSGSSGSTATVELWDITSNTGITGSQMVTTSTTVTVIRSNQFTLIPGHQYGITAMISNSAYDADILDASLIVFPQ